MLRRTHNWPLSSLLIATLTTAATAQQPFWIGMLPDTQHYTTDPVVRMRHFREMVAHLTLWRPDFVTHVGDLTQNADPVEFERAMGAMAPFDAFGIPYRICAGNHDYEDGRKPDLTTFRRYTAGSPTWYVDDRFLAINLEWLPSDAEIEIARQVMEAHPRLPTILTTHEWLYAGNPAERSLFGANKDGDGDNSAEETWQKLVVPYPQVVMVLCGHKHGEGLRTETTAFGRIVHQMLFNPQDDPFGGQGFFRCIAWRPGDIGVWSLTMTWAGMTPNRTSFFTLPTNLSAIPRARHLRTGQDTFVIPSWPNSARGTHEQVFAANTGAFEKGLLRFDLPTDLRSCSQAVLTLCVEGYGADGDGLALHRMRRAWSPGSTWTTLGGLTLGLDAEAVPTVNTGTLGKGTINVDVTADVRAWLTTTPNHGWLVQGRGASVAFRSFDWRAPAERPLLTIVP